MGRRPKAAVEAAESTTETKPVVRRRRPRTAVDQTAQTQILVSTLLKARGGSGAKQADLLAVVNWARSIGEEGAELRTLASRVRKSRTGGPERQVAYEVNKALLDGVLAGQMTVNVNDAGNVVFADSEASSVAAE